MAPCFNRTWSTDGTSPGVALARCARLRGVCTGHLAVVEGYMGRDTLGPNPPMNTDAQAAGFGPLLERRLWAIRWTAPQTWSGLLKRSWNADQEVPLIYSFYTRAM